MMGKKMFVGVIIGSAIFLAYTFGITAGEKENKKAKDDLFRQIELFSDTLAIIQTDYVDEKKSKDLIYGALKGMMSSLDPHSQFMDPDSYNELKIDTEGKFGGLGIEVTIKDGLLTVVTPIEDTPAWKAGVKSNDRIVKISDDVTRDMSLTDAVKKLRGKPGEPVTITVLRESEKRILDIKIVRAIIKIKDIKESKILENGIGYIRLVEFRENTARDLNTSIDALIKQGMKGFILDLRNNPGGLLNVAVDVSDKFLETGKLIVYTKGRQSGQNLRFVSHAASPIVSLPMVVMINEGSASGSEIVAGCLQDYKRAIILGVKSFGKGSVQSVVPLSDGSALRLTTSKYFTPLGRMIHEKGIIPDIVVVDGKIETFGKEDLLHSKAAEVFNDLQAKDDKDIGNGKTGGSTDTSNGKVEAVKDTVFDYTTDNQLMRAIDALKAIIIFKGDILGK